MPEVSRPRVVVVLSESWTLASGRDLPELVRWAREAEDAGADAVMLSEHVVLGPDAGALGRMANPREYAMPGNQDPATPWPASLLLLSAMASVTTTIRLAAAAVITPLRHPLLLANELATLDLLSRGRLVVQPTVSWHEQEYAALGVPFRERGARLDEQLEVWAKVWAAGPDGGPVSHSGRFWTFDDVWVSPGPWHADGPRMWLGGSSLHPALLRRVVAYAHGYHPLGQPGRDVLDTLDAALREAGRDPADLEVVGGLSATFPADDACADLGAALADVPRQWADGYTTFCVKPSQFVDDAREIGPFVREVVRRVEAACG